MRTRVRKERERSRAGMKCFQTACLRISLFLMNNVPVRHIDMENKR